ncbi:hypothetical protein [Gemmatimonas sp.]|uniref:hypothetical protein n=1 Tax=Gemmatimonas sp. TaxID=1962908 RepID=UPI00286DB654|nr:hypothetical protein [Gemmatimonas sp.]
MRTSLAPGAVALALAALCATGARAQGLDPTPASQCGERTVTVQPDSAVADTRVLIRFAAGLASDTDDAFLARALGKLVAERIRQTLSIDVRSRGLSGGSGSADAASAVAEGRVLGVRYVLVGTVQRRDDRSVIDWRLVDARSGKQTSSGVASEPVGAVDSLVNAMTSVMTRALGRTATKPAARDRLHSRSPDAILSFLRGLAEVEAFDRGRLQRADSALQRAIDLDPAFVAARFRLAELSVRQLDWVEHSDRARAQLVQTGLWSIGAVLLKEPYDVQALALLGRLYLHKGTPALAQPIVLALRALAPDEPATVELDARVARALGRDDEALKTVRASAAATERSIDALMVRADLERRVGDRVVACRVLNRAIALDATHAPAYVWRAIVRSNLGELREGWGDAEVASRLGRADWGELTGALIDVAVRDTVRARTRVMPLMTASSLDSAGWLDLVLRAAVANSLTTPAAAQRALLRISCRDPRRVGLANEPLLRYLRLPTNCIAPRTKVATGAN